MSVLAGVILAGGKFVVTVVLARRLGTNIFGQVSYYQWLVDLIALVCSFGLPASITRFLPAAIATTTVARRDFARFGGVAVAAVTLCACSTITGALYTGTPAGVSILLGTWASVSLLSSLSTATLIALAKFKDLAVCNVIVVCSQCLLAVLWIDGASSVSVLCAALMGTTALGVLHNVYSIVSGMRTVKLGKSGYSEWREVRAYSANVWIVGLVSALLWSRGEIGVLGRFASPSDVGVYLAAISLTSPISLAVGLLNGAITPHLSKAWGCRDTLRISTIVRISSLATMWAAFSAAVLVMAFGNEIVGLILGRAFAGATAPLPLLLIATTSQSGGAINLLLQFATNGSVQLRTTWLGFFALAAIALAFVQVNPLVGAATARCVVLVSVVTYMIWLIRSHGQPDLSNLLLKRWAMCHGVTLALTFVVWSHLEIPLPYRAAIAFISVCIISLVLLNRADSEVIMVDG